MVTLQASDHANEYIEHPERAPRNEKEDDQILEHIHYHCVSEAVAWVHCVPRVPFDKAGMGKLADDILRKHGYPPRREIWNQGGIFHSKDTHAPSQLDKLKGRVMGSLQRVSGALGSVRSKHNGGGGGRLISLPMPKGFTPIETERILSGKMVTSI